MEEEINKSGLPRKKKELIAGLLFLSSLVCFLLLLKNPPNSGKQLRSLAQADTLIMQELHEFNIKPKQIHIRNIKVNKKFTRKVYTVDLPVQLSKTYLHVELNQKLYPFHIKDPAIVHLPEGNMDIQLAYGGDIIRTIKLVSDTAIKYRRYAGTILAYIDHKPTDHLMRNLDILGSHLPIVFQVPTAGEGKDWFDVINNDHAHVIFWITGDDPFNTSPNELFWHLRNQIKVLRRIFRKPAVLIYPSANDRIRTLIELDSQKYGISYVDARNAISINPGKGHLHFERELQHFMRLAEKDKRPLMLIKVTDQSLQWLRKYLPKFEKSGLVLVPPITNHY